MPTAQRASVTQSPTAPNPDTPLTPLGGVGHGTTRCPSAASMPPDSRASLPAELNPAIVAVAGAGPTPRSSLRRTRARSILGFRAGRTDPGCPPPSPPGGGGSAGATARSHPPSMRGPRRPGPGRTPGIRAGGPAGRRARAMNQVREYADSTVFT